MDRTFQSNDVDITNEATLAVKPLRAPLVLARAAFSEALETLNHLEAEYIKAWNDAASAASAARGKRAEL